MVLFKAPVPISSSTDYCKVEPPSEPMTPPAKRSKLDVHQENDLNKSIKPADFIEVKSENCNMGRFYYCLNVSN